ncbi:MAG: CoA transferase [Lachnospiraceae bacterium]|nr:CoA transferase [Lachnospiraceae bacterium]
MSITKPLEGIRVIEFANFVAAPAAGRLLTDWGASVIRVESFAGDSWRFYGRNCGVPVTEQENPLFDIYNANKRDILINTKIEEGRQVLLRLLKEADVFLTNNRQKALVKAGLDYDSLKEEFPRLIYAQVTGYGQQGPDVDAPGYDGVAFFSRSGLLADVAEPGGYPATAPGCVGDCMTGTTLFGAICAALFARERTGKGDMVEVSLFGSAVWACAAMSTFTQYGYEYPKKREVMSALYTFYQCKDGEWIQLAITEGDRHWRALAEALEIPETADDPRFLDAGLISKNRSELIPILERAFRRFDSKEIVDRLRKADIVFDRLRHYREISQDPQAEANQYIRAFTFENGNQYMMPMTPIRSRNIGDMPCGRGPHMGEHTDQILKENGYADAEIAALKNDGAVRQHP